MSEEIQDLLDAIDMELYLDREAFDYKKTSGSRGPQLNVKECPSCGNDKWKVYIGTETGLGNCFVCGVGFNKSTFIKAHLGTEEWSEVFKHLREVAKEWGWRPRKTVAPAGPVAPPSEWTLPRSLPLPIEGQNLKYLEDRGIPLGLAVHFELRYCEDGWFNYVDENGERRGQYYGSRILIPVYDLAGKLQTFQGRDLTGQAERKYQFPPKLPAAGRFLYNAHRAIGAKRAALGEGAFDVYGLEFALRTDPALNDVAALGSFGKHLSFGNPGGDQLSVLIELKAKGLEELTIVWDGEAEALDAALSAAKLITKWVGIKVKIAILPAGKDPGDAGAQTIRYAYNRALPYTSTLHMKVQLRNPYKNQ
jgi:DNA primase